MQDDDQDEDYFEGITYTEWEKRHILRALARLARLDWSIYRRMFRSSTLPAREPWLELTLARRSLQRSVIDLVNCQDSEIR